MKCPRCVEEGMRSRIDMGGGTFRTAMASHSFYDEEGAFHHHDPNTSTTQGFCTNGHRIIWTSSGGCSVPGCTYEIHRSVEVV